MKKLITIVVMVWSLMVSISAFAQLPSGQNMPALAFDQMNNLYCGAYANVVNGFTDITLRGQLLNPDGTLNGGELTPSTAAYITMPNVAYDPLAQNYLIAYEQQNASMDMDIYGQLVHSDGTLVGSNFAISDAMAGEQTMPALAFDTVNQRFLVAWDDTRSGTGTIYAQLINTDGTLHGANVVIFNASAVDTNNGPAVAYDATNQRFFVAWAHTNGGAGLDVFGQLLNTDGSLLGTNFAISEAGAANNQQGPTAAYDGVTQRYVVAWQDMRNGANYNIYGQLVDANGTLVGTNMPVTIGASDQMFPVSVFDDMQARFLVIWTFSSGGGDDHVSGQFVQGDGTLVGSAFQVSPETNVVFRSALAYNALCRNFLVSYVINTPTTELRYAVIGDPCETTPPTVTATSPAADAVDVAVNAAVTATFSEAMRASTIDATTFSLNGGVTGSVTYDAATMTATFTPSAALTASTAYTATITTGVKDAIGNSMAADVVWSFTTAVTPESGGGCSLMPPRGTR